MSTDSLDMRIVDHPLVRSRLTRLRDEHTSSAGFRELLTQLTGMLIYEAMADQPVDDVVVRTPIGPCPGAVLAQTPLMVPVLRAGLGMLPAATAAVPEAQIGFVGIARDEHTALPREYLVSLPEDLSGWPVFVLDPMLATAGSMLHTLDVLAARGATDVTAVCVVAAPEGIAALTASPHAPRLVIGGLDDGLNEASFIVPGLGDAGDRLFGPRNF
ncbi:uracil phosphoribosyltransferase [Gordonia phosphorivorans]|uniref:Uracil phosphoribosyltransferase n=1 Tax=Gordonia phosphorivorans TaxID=1056982 RepID=A0ABV6HAX8_9ACTN